MVKRYEHRHGGMMPVNREVDTYVSSSDYAKLEAERDALREMAHNLLYVIDAVDALTAAYFDDIKAARTALGGGSDE